MYVTLHYIYHHQSLYVMQLLRCLAELDAQLGSAVLIVNMFQSVNTAAQTHDYITLRFIHSCIVGRIY